MQSTFFWRLMGALAALLPLIASADVYSLRAIYPQEETVYLGADGSVSVRLMIRVKPLGSAGIATPQCDALVDFGDQSPALALRLGEDGRVLSELSHTYSRSGNYVLRVRAAATRSACEGGASGELSVRAAAERPPAETKPPTNAQAAAAALPSITLETRPTSSADVCPSGWFLVQGSMSAGRFTCHLAPVKPFNCAAGTTYFDNGNTLGCR